MSGGPVSDRAGYLGVVQSLGKQALAVAVDAAPHRARQGERRWPMARALPAARVLIDQATDDAADADADADADAEPQALAQAADALHQALADPAGKVTDGFGHTRPIYPLLAIHVLGTAARLTENAPALAHTRDAAHALCTAPSPTQHPHDHTHDNDPRLAVWRRLIAHQHAIQHAEPMPLDTGGPAPLATLGLNDLIDSWTYRELVGLHGLHLLAQLTSDATLAKHAQNATLYHLGHTQPDYTTYQPWGLSVFASDPQTTVFAEQQLHDVATHLSIEGAGGAVLPALLLADAAATMAGRVALAWTSP